MCSLPESRTVNLLGVDISAMRMDQLLGICDEHIHNKTSLLLAVVNVAKLIHCRRNPELRKSVTEADLVLADGLPLVWLSKLIGDPLPERVAGIDIMFRLLEHSSRKNCRVFFLGAEKKTVQKLADVVGTKYPGVRIAGARDGYFDASEEKEVARQIRNSSADIIFVGMSSPRKENFLRNWRQYMNVPICHGVGGSFDVVAGMTKRAPRLMQQYGMEWLYRLFQEPKRMWKRYLITNTIFIKLSLQAILRARLSKLLHSLANLSVSTAKDLSK